MTQTQPKLVTSVSLDSPCDEALKYNTLCDVNFKNLISLTPSIKNEVLCQTECEKTPNCSHYTFYTSATQPATTSCALLRYCDYNSTTSCSKVPECKTAVSGSRTPAIKEACCAEFAVQACRGEILAQHFQVPSPEKCQLICRDTDLCSFFTLLVGNICFLYSSCDETEPCSSCTTGPASPTWDQCKESISYETLLIGGWTNTDGSYSRNMELVTELLSCEPDMPKPPVGRYHAASAMLGRTILYCGGYLNIVPYYHAECYSYLLGKSGATWKPAASMNHPRYHFTIEVVQGQAFAIGGTSAWGTTTGQTVEVFTPGDGWKVSDQMKMPSYRYYHCSATIDTRIIVIGGSYAGSTYSHSVIQFDLSAPENGWTSLASLTYGRQNHACQVGNFQGQQGIFVTGGSDNGHTLVEFYLDVLNRWRKLPSMSSSRTYHTSSLIGNKIFVHGGSGAESSQEMFNRTWTSGTNLGISRRYHTSVSVPKGTLNCTGLNRQKIGKDNKMDVNSTKTIDFNQTSIDKI